MRALVFALLLCSTLTAAAQECVTCRGDRCKGMFWIPLCAGKKPPRPLEPKPHTPPVRCGEKGLQLEVDFPPEVEEGDLLGIRMRTTCEAWLVVYFLEDNGPGAILWPSKLEPAPTAGPARPASLPSPREMNAGNRIEAQLARPGQPSNEQFVVFAFADKADFERLKPRGKLDGRRYAAELGSKLPALKAGTWATFTARYTIVPRR